MNSLVIKDSTQCHLINMDNVIMLTVEVANGGGSRIFITESPVSKGGCVTLNVKTAKIALVEQLEALGKR